MRVGIVAAEPWTSVSPEGPSGAEVDLLRRLASELDAAIKWTEGSEEELLTALQQRELDAVIGGLTEDNPWSGAVAFTRPYDTTRVLVGVPPGSALPEDLDGLRVRAREGTDVPGLVEEAGGIAVRVPGLGPGAPAAGPDFELGSLGLALTDLELRTTRHVMALPAGENAWIVHVERFLGRDPELADRLLEEHA
jgi:ABC-type amino acid transport substrate-binding protein